MITAWKLYKQSNKTQYIIILGDFSMLLTHPHPQIQKALNHLKQWFNKELCPQTWLKDSWPFWAPTKKKSQMLLWKPQISSSSRNNRINSSLWPQQNFRSEKAKVLYQATFGLNGKYNNIPKNYGIRQKSAKGKCAAISGIESKWIITKNENKWIEVREKLKTKFKLLAIY